MLCKLRERERERVCVCVCVCVCMCVCVWTASTTHPVWTVQITFFNNSFRLKICWCAEHTYMCFFIHSSEQKDSSLESNSTNANLHIPGKLTLNPKLFVSWKYFKHKYAFNAHYLHFCPSSDSNTKASIVIFTTSSHYRVCNSQHSQLSYTHSELKQPFLPEEARILFCKPVHALRARGSQPSPNATKALSQQPSRACHPAGNPTHSLLLHPPSTVSPFLLTQNLHASMRRLSFLRSALWCNQRCMHSKYLDTVIN